jgi:putative nucleotidyltransferase with HDIG domain
MRILIVEDDLSLGSLLKEYLQRLGHERVHWCPTGGDAHAVIEREHFDCAFIDLMLPDMDGLELLNSIKARNPTIPIIMMSGYPTMEYAIEAMRKGASDFLTKPFNLHDLALTIERVGKERRLMLENLSLQLEHQTRRHVEQLNRELQQRIQEQAKLFEIAQDIEEIRSSERLYPCIVSLAGRLTGARKAGFFIIPNDPDALLLISEQGFTQDEQVQRIYGIGDERLREILQPHVNHLVFSAHDLGSDSALKHFATDGSLLSCWPFRIRGQTFGCLLTSHNGPGDTLPESDANLLNFLVKKAALAIENMALYESLVSNFYGILKSLVNALEAKDPYTGKHSERVTNYAVLTARQLDCSAAQIASLRTIGYLHDIGKIGIADQILNKPAALSDEEYELIKKHPVIGESIVADLGLSLEERAIIRHHHERWDGRGYPDGLAENDIPLLARIVTVADAFDSMTSKRAYRHAMSRESALSELADNEGKQFDPQVVAAFMSACKSVKGAVPAYR